MGIFQTKHKYKPPTRTITKEDRAIADLKSTRMKLTKEQQRIDKAILREVAVAKELIAAKRKERALLALKKKRLHEQQLDRVNAFLLNINQVLDNIEAAQRQNRVFAALTEGQEALASLQQLVTLDDVEQLMSDSARAKEYEGQIRQALGESLTGEDDAAALEEFNQLEKEVLKEEVAELPVAPEIPEGKRKEDMSIADELPAVPTHAVQPTEELRAGSSQLEKTVAAEEPMLAS